MEQLATEHFSDAVADNTGSVDAEFHATATHQISQQRQVPSMSAGTAFLQWRPSSPSITPGSSPPSLNAGSLWPLSSPCGLDRKANTRDVLSEMPPAGCDADAIKLFIGNIPKSYREAQLMPLFESIGKVILLIVVRDKTTRESKGSAFLWYATRAHAELAVKHFHGRYTLPDDTESKRLPAIVVRRANPRRRIGKADSSVDAFQPGFTSGAASGSGTASGSGSWAGPGKDLPVARIHSSPAGLPHHPQPQPSAGDPWAKSLGARPFPGDIARQSAAHPDDQAQMQQLHLLSHFLAPASLTAPSASQPPPPPPALVLPGMDTLQSVGGTAGLHGMPPWGTSNPPTYRATTSGGDFTSSGPSIFPMNQVSGLVAGFQRQISLDYDPAASAAAATSSSVSDMMQSMQRQYLMSGSSLSNALSTGDSSAMGYFDWVEAQSHLSSDGTRDVPSPGLVSAPMESASDNRGYRQPGLDKPAGAAPPVSMYLDVQQLNDISPHIHSVMMLTGALVVTVPVAQGLFCISISGAQEQTNAARSMLLTVIGNAQVA